MSAKLLIIAACSALGCLGGFFIFRSYRRTAEYYSELCMLITELKRNMSYRKDGAASVLMRYESGCALLKRHTGEYIAYASGKADKPSLSRGFLDDAQYEKVSAFFSSLGGGDGGAQSAELSAYLNEFGALKSEAEQRLKTRGGAAVKMGLLLGLGAGVLIL